MKHGLSAFTGSHRPQSPLRSFHARYGPAVHPIRYHASCSANWQSILPMGRGIGSALLRHALERCVDAAERIGGRAVIVRAIDSDAEGYWRACDFVASSSDSSLLFRSVSDI